MNRRYVYAATARTRCGLCGYIYVGMFLSLVMVAIVACTFLKAKFMMHRIVLILIAALLACACTKQTKSPAADATILGASFDTNTKELFANLMTAPDSLLVIDENTLDFPLWDTLDEDSITAQAKLFGWNGTIAIHVEPDVEFIPETDYEEVNVIGHITHTVIFRSGEMTSHAYYEILTALTDFYGEPFHDEEDNTYFFGSGSVYAIVNFVPYGELGQTVVEFIKE